MAIMGKETNWDEVANRSERELLPKGSHQCVFVSNENKETRNTNPLTGYKGQMIVITVMIQGGPLNGKLFYENLNWDCAPKSTSQEDIDKATMAEKIAEKTASNIAKALSLPSFNGDVDLFNNKCCIVDIDQVPGKNGYGPSNTFRYRPLGSAAPGVAGAVPPGFGQPAAADPAAGTPANPFAQRA